MGAAAAHRRKHCNPTTRLGRVWCDVVNCARARQVFSFELLFCVTLLLTADLSNAAPQSMENVNAKLFLHFMALLMETIC